MGNENSQEGLPDDKPLDNPDHSFAGVNRTVVGPPKEGNEDAESRKSGATA